MIGLHRARLLVVRALIGASILFLLGYLSVGIARLGYPYDLEWMEGGVADHVARVAAGEPIYVPPSIDFTPYIYTPLYYYAGAAAWNVLGEGLPALRSVSFMASIGCFTIIALIVHRETGSRAAALVAAGHFAACFRAGGAWLDLARNDSLFLVLTLAGILAARRASVRAAIAAGVLFFLAFFSKQTAILAVAPLLVGLPLIPSRRRRFTRLVPLFLFAALVAASTWGMNAATDGWYGFYVFDLPSQHPLETPSLAGFWLRDIALVVPLGLAVGLGGWIALRARREAFFFHALALAGLLGASWSGRLHSGGFDNVLIPAYAGVSIALGFGLAGTLREAEDSPTSSRTAPRGIGKWVPLLAIVQILLLAWDPRDAIPSRADREAGDRLVALIRDLPGEVLVPGRGHMTRLAGKPAFAHDMALDDVFRGSDGEAIARLESDIAGALRDRRFGAILVDYAPWGIFQPAIDAGYEHRGGLIRDPDLLMPRTGLPTRPEEIYVRREAPRAP